MGLHSTSITGAGKGPQLIIRGCPCYKKFDEECICLNDDDITPIYAISVDPSFFSADSSVDSLDEFKSDKPNMCYLLIFLDKDNDKTYCLSQGKEIRINSQSVKASDIEEALSFVNMTEQSSDGAVCSDCLYKYLVTLGDVFEDLLSDTERTGMIKDYIKTASARMVDELEGVVHEEEDDESRRLRIRERITHLMKKRAEWASLIHDRQKVDEDEDLLALLDAYRTLTRLESVFLLQVSSLAESSDELVALGILKFMVEVSSQVVQVVNRIRDLTHCIWDEDKMPEDLEEILKKERESRRRADQTFNNIVRVLSDIK
jgi:hypothetical protein